MHPGFSLVLLPPPHPQPFGLESSSAHSYVRPRPRGRRGVTQCKCGQFVARVDMQPAASAAGINQAGPYTLTGWIASDMDTTVLEGHNAAALRRLGVRIRKLNSFDVYSDDEVQNAPALVIQACVWPPPDTLDYLGHLMRRYNYGHYAAAYSQEPTHLDKCRFYETIIFEALVGQIPAGTIISICRSSDYIKSSSTPVVVAPLGHVPGYVPKSQHIGENGQLETLVGSHSLIARASVGGPFNPQDFLGSRGHLNLIAMCSAAQAYGLQVIFLGEFDGTLSLGCATGVLYWQQEHRQLLTANWVQPTTSQLKTLGGYTGKYSDFYDHAKDEQIAKILQAYLRDGGDPANWAVPTQTTLQPYVNVNAAVMWFYAKVGAMGGAAANYVDSEMNAVLTSSPH